MLNLIALISLLSVLFGPASGFLAAHEAKAGTPAIYLFSIGGLLFGIGVAALSRKLAYGVFCAKTLPSPLHIFIPVAGLLLVIFVPFLLAMAAGGRR